MAQVGERARLDHPTGPDDAHPVAQALDLGQDVAGEQDGPAAVAEPAHAGLEAALHDRVQAGRRLVEEQQVHLGGQRCHQRHLLSVALGVGASPLREVELEEVHELGAPGGDQPTSESTEEVDDLATAQVRPQGDVPRHIGETAMQLGRLPPRVAPEQPDLTRVCAEQTEQHPDGGGLPGAVGAEEAVDLALADPEVQTVECAGAAEGLDQVLDVDGESIASNLLRGDQSGATRQSESPSSSAARRSPRPQLRRHPRGPRRAPGRRSAAAGRRGSARRRAGMVRPRADDDAVDSEPAGLRWRAR